MVALASLAMAIAPLAMAYEDAQPPQSAQATGDQRLYEALRDVINRGADLYNGGDPNGCYRLFQGALMVARLQLDGHPDLQKSIDTGMADADRQFSLAARAHALRKVLDRVRAGIKPADQARGPDKDRNPPSRPPASTRPSTLWDRLGGEENVRKVVNDFVALAGSDPKVDFSRGGKYKLDDTAVAHLKKELIDFVSQASGGPYPYPGKSMKEVHKGMGISDAEFDAAAADLRKALEKNGAKPEDITQVLQAVEQTRADIVQPPAKKP
jgi:hemoglobin